ALGTLGLHAQLVDPPRRLLDLLERLLLLRPARRERVTLLLRLRERALDRLAHVPRLLRRRGELDLELDDAAVRLVELERRAVDLDSQPRRRLVDEVDRLVGQEPVGDIAVRENGRGDERSVADADAVVRLVAFLEPAQNRDRVGDRRLVDVDRREPPLEGGVLLDVLAVLVERRRADTAQLAAREHWLEQVRGVDPAFRRSSNSPRYFEPASSAPMSSAQTRRSRSPSGTSPPTIRCASPSAIAVLPTPGSPISTGLFFVRRERIWITRRISSSRPITGSSFPCSAASVRSRPNFSSAW